MNGMDQKLIKFARRVLAILQDDHDWGPDTVEQIQQAAVAGDLADVSRFNVFFKARPEVFE